MSPKEVESCTAFSQFKIISCGSVKEVALEVKDYLKHHPKAQVLIFDDETSLPVEIDLRGSVEALERRLTDLEENHGDERKKPGPGRPKLGVIAKEVTLLPQHWDWLARQPGGASVTLRKLVEEAKKKNHAKDQLRQAQESLHRFMTAMAGDLPDYEEALRALYAKDKTKFSRLISRWPRDLREHVTRLAKRAL